LYNVDGILIENGEAEMLTNAIVKLIGDQERRFRMGEKARKNILCFSSSSVMKQWENLFENL